MTAAARPTRVGGAGACIGVHVSDSGFFVVSVNARPLGISRCFEASPEGGSKDGARSLPSSIPEFALPWGCLLFAPLPSLAALRLRSVSAPAPHGRPYILNFSFATRARASEARRILDMRLSPWAVQPSGWSVHRTAQTGRQVISRELLRHAGLGLVFCRSPAQGAWRGHAACMHGRVRRHERIFPKGGRQAALCTDRICSPTAACCAASGLRMSEPGLASLVRAAGMQACSCRGHASSTVPRPPARRPILPIWPAAVLPPPVMARRRRQVSLQGARCACTYAAACSMGQLLRLAGYVESALPAPFAAESAPAPRAQLPTKERDSPEAAERRGCRAALWGGGGERRRVARVRRAAESVSGGGEALL
eukprot:362080-Chlamydomonas_euryale.AAC.4